MRALRARVIQFSAAGARRLKSRLTLPKICLRGLMYFARTDIGFCQACPACPYGYGAKF